MTYSCCEMRRDERRVSCPSKQSPPNPTSPSRNLTQRNKLPGYHSFQAKDLTSKQSLISAHILSPQELSSTLTSLPATHHCLLRTNISAKSFVENITQFKTGLHARDYPNSLVERITSELKFRGCLHGGRKILALGRS